MLESAAQGSYEKTWENACQEEDRVSRETVMRRVHSFLRYIPVIWQYLFSI